MVPKGWSYCRLEELSKIIDCKHRTPVYVADGVPVISPGTIKWGPIDLVTPVKRVTYEDYQSLMDHCQIDIGDLVMSRNQSVGVVSYIDKNQPFVLGQDTVLLKPRHIDSSFLFQFFQSVPFQRAITKQSGGSTFARINLGVIKELTIVTPPLPEQRKIAQILSIWDKAIATTERLLANKEQQKKALMQRLLTGKQRFAGFEGEWQIVKLGSVAEMNSGGTPKSTIEDYYGGQIPWVSIADMTSKGKWIDSTVKYLTQLGLDNSSARIYPVNTVLYAMYASIGECSIAKVELASSQAILGIRPSAQLHFEFLYFYLCSLKDKIKLQGQQGTQANLNAGMVKEFLIPLPSINEQRQIASVLCLADNELTIIQLQLENLKQQKKALMQQLLTGKRRVKVDEAAA